MNDKMILLPDINDYIDAYKKVLRAKQVKESKNN